MAERRPNVLFLTSDQQRFDCLGVNSDGYVQTPAIDRLAAEGVNLTGCYVNNPVCAPSRATLLTGRYPRNHGVTSNGIALSEDELTVAQILSDAGYRTGNLGKLHFVPLGTRDFDRPHPGFGFDVHVNADEPGCFPDDYIRWIRRVAPGMEDKVGIPHPITGDRSKHYWDFEAPEELSYTAWVADQTIGFIDAAGDTPWFAVAGFYLPHAPCNPPAEYVDRYPTAGIPRPDVVPGELDDKPEMVRYLAENLLPDTNEEVTRYRQYYYASCTMVDHHCGRVIEHLRRSGQLDNTIVVYFSDHGDACGDNFTLGKHQAHYDSFMKVPMVWRWPGGLPGGRTFEGFFEGVDLVPTLLEALSLPIPVPVDGTSLWEQLAGGDGPGKDCVLMEYFDPGIEEVVHAVPNATRYTLSGWSVLTLIDEQNKYWIDGEGNEILYDRKADPGEHVNLAGDPAYSAALGRMRKALLVKLASTYDRRHRKFASV